MLLTGLAPIAGPSARILILGSMPGAASLAQQSYYAHPANAFWSLLGSVLGCEFPADQAARGRLLIRHRIALWDVVHRCRRSGSLDSAIERASVEPNDLPGLLRQYPLIEYVFFNGAAAETLYRRHLRARIDVIRPGLCCHRLPSSSPANASWTRARKLAAWQAIAVALSGAGSHGTVLDIRA
ncbi:MAG: DNA-deoxyinosine glycosylase [Pseudomonadales bacterium]|nr:DNA-deoxyinosine glycosylase [Pseudomonadales bacterium]